MTFGLYLSSPNRCRLPYVGGRSMLISPFNRITSADGQLQNIEAIDLSMTQDVLPGIPSIIIRSDIIRVTGSIKLPSQNLTILCRRLICTNSPTITTAATGTILSYTNQSAGVGTSNGAEGTKGNDGGVGGNGGNIAIVVGSLEGVLLLDSSGQNGGDAQNGGDGCERATRVGLVSYVRTRSWRERRKTEAKGASLESQVTVEVQAR